MKDNPFDQFALWFAERKLYWGDPTEMILSTCSEDRPTSRVVLMKDFSEKGITFYTNYDSVKGRQLEENPFASLMFFWSEIRMQIRIEGTVSKVPRWKSEEYFATRPYLRQIGAHASQQSEPLESRADLLKRAYRVMLMYKTHVPCPENWGGYILEPDYFEFWRKGNFRLHRRTVYTKTKQVGDTLEWETCLLNP